MSSEISQVTVAPARGPAPAAREGRFEDLAGRLPSVDAVLFQSLAQYIDPAQLWSVCRQACQPAGHVAVLDELPVTSDDRVPPWLRQACVFASAADGAGFALIDERDLTALAVRNLDVVARALVSRARVPQNFLGYDEHRLAEGSSGLAMLQQAFEAGVLRYAARRFERRR